MTHTTICDHCEKIYDNAEGMIELSILFKGNNKHFCNYRCVYNYVKGYLEEVNNEL